LLAERVKAVLLFGASREIFEAAWQGAIPLYWDADLTQAMGRARALAAPGDVVLLSPATSSYDAFANYKERGDRFCRLVGALAAEASSPKEAV
jgi:UDP-N-acetylmuramoylalanine--D-glutamate ligase